MVFRSLSWNFLISILMCMIVPLVTEGENFKGYDHILCRECGSDVASALSIVNLRSPAALSRVNKTIFGLEEVDIQTIRNALNIQFEIITVLDATCSTSVKDFFLDHTWFPGFAWKSCTCSRCHRHLGWLFEPLHLAEKHIISASDKGFYALSVSGLISEFYSNQLLIRPNTVSIR